MNDKNYKFGKKIHDDIENLIEEVIIFLITFPILFVFALLLRPPGTFFVC